MPAKKKITVFRGIVRNIIFATNIIAILLLFSSFLSWRVSPLKTNLFSYIGIAFGFIFFLNVMYLFLWISFKKWKLALVSLVSLILCHNPITTFFPMNLFPEKAPENSLKILTYNVEGFINENKPFIDAQGFYFFQLATGVLVFGRNADIGDVHGGFPSR